MDRLASWHLNSGPGDQQPGAEHKYTVLRSCRADSLLPPSRLLRSVEVLRVAAR